ncbi:prenyltransferase/squalene oxidase repeat-containing protein [Mycoplasmatota bacterium WC30]
MNLIDWLLEGDVSIQYQTYRDLLSEERFNLKSRIITEGFGKMLLDKQESNGHWGGGYYHYKWINTHYTLLELRRLNATLTPSITNIINYILDNIKTDDGGVMPNPKVWKHSDVCINGMNLNYMCFFSADENKLKSIIDFIIDQQLPDGGFNCNYNYPKYGARHSSLHSTISMIEGFNSYINFDYTYKVEIIKKLRKDAIEFILLHRLFKSDRTGEIIKKQFTMLSYPPRWKYDILRALEAFREAMIPYDDRMSDAFNILFKKRKKDGTWLLQSKHQGRVHFDMETVGKSSRWNTLRILRVLKHFFPDKDSINK